MTSRARLQREIVERAQPHLRDGFDALIDVGHTGLLSDAQAMASLLFDFATRPEYRAALNKEFDGIKALFAEYQDALRKTYVVPRVPVP